MQRTSTFHTARTAKTSVKQSPVKAVLSWLVETDREFRVTQSMVNNTHDRI